MSHLSDDAFLAFAKKQEEEALAKQSSGGGSTEQRTFEQIQWAGLERGKMKVVRFLGGVPDSKNDNFTAKTVRIAWIVGDDGKRFRVVFPDRSEAPDHILWRIISRVNQVEWKDGKKTYPIKDKYPTIYNIVDKNGLDPGNSRYLYDRGWVGRQVLIANVIDREQMDWHKENKHSVLLSRNISTDAEGRTYADEGIPVYGFVGSVSNLFRYYGSWEKYDIGIERTGLKETPYRIINASKNIEEVPANVKDVVFQGPLSEEELNWERYDLDKLFGYTSHTKILNRMQAKVAKIDAILNSNFLKELKDEAEIERKRWEESKQEEEATVEEDENAPVMDDEEQSVEVPKAPPTRKPKSSSANLKAIPYWEQLSKEEQEAISSAAVKDGKITEIVYKDPNAVLFACPTCKTPAPDFFTMCPSCGDVFA